MVTLENEVKALGLQRQREESLDWFRERQEEQDERLAEQEREERMRLAEEEAERRREEWLRHWETYALRLLSSLMYDAPAEIRLAVHQAVRDRLTKLDPIPTDSVTRQLVDAEVAKKIERWKWTQQIQEILVECRDRRLPSAAQRFWSSDPLSQWQLRAANAASDAMQKQIREGIQDMHALRAIAYRAVEPIKQEFEHQQRCGKIVPGVSLSGATNDEYQEAKEAVADALAALPIGASEKQMESARDTALAPFRQRIVQREADAHRAHLRRLDQAMRENIIAWASFPWGLPPEDKQRAVAAAQKAIDGLPEGTERGELEAARDRALQPFLTAHAQREEQASRKSAAESRLRGVGLSELLCGSSNPIFRYLGELERRDEIEFRDFNDLWDTSKKVLQKIGPILLGEILQDPKMTDEQINDRMEKLVDEHVGEFLEV